MNLVACDSAWQVGPNGEAVCSGTLQIVVGGGPFGLPPITYADAGLLLGAIGLVYAAVFGVCALRKPLSMR